jgi:hypothetical protein
LSFHGTSGAPIAGPPVGDFASEQAAEPNAAAKTTDENPLNLPKNMFFCGAMLREIAGAVKS